MCPAWQQQRRQQERVLADHRPRLQGTLCDCEHVAAVQVSGARVKGLVGRALQKNGESSSDCACLPWVAAPDPGFSKIVHLHQGRIQSSGSALPSRRQLWEALPEIFVGRASQLAPVLQLISLELALMFEGQGQQLPPWRTYAATTARWLSNACADVAVPSLSVQSPPAAGSGVWDLDLSDCAEVAAGPSLPAATPPALREQREAREPDGRDAAAAGVDPTTPLANAFLAQCDVLKSLADTVRDKRQNLVGGGGGGAGAVQHDPTKTAPKPGAVGAEAVFRSQLHHPKALQQQQQRPIQCIVVTGFDLHR